MSATFATRLVAYAPNGPKLGLLPDALTYTGAYPFNDLSSLTTTYPAETTVRGGNLMARGLEQGLEVALEIAGDSVDAPGGWVEPRNSRFLLLKRSTDLSAPTGSLSLTLPSYGWNLKKARNLKSTDLNAEGKRVFGKATPGTIMATLIQEARARGALPGMNVTFNSQVDSAGAPWKNLLNIEYEIGLDLATILTSLSTQGVCDFSFAGRTLELFNADTTLAIDRSGGLDPVTLRLGRDISGAPQEESLEDVVSTVLIKGDGLTLTENNPAAPAPWGVWEGYISQGGVNSEATARTLVQADLERGSRVRGEYTRELLFTAGQALPFLDYAPGDYLSAPGGQGLLERLRVRQVTVGYAKDGVTGSLVLNDRVVERELRTTRRITGIVGGSTAGGGSGALPAPERPENDTRLPAAPTNLILDSGWYLDVDGIARGNLLIDWTPVTTTAEKGEAFEVGGYEIYGRPNQEGLPFTELTAVPQDQSDAAYGPLEPGSEWAIKVRAFGLYNNLRGPFSETAATVVARDTTPPPKPSRLTAVARLGVLKLTWDGLSENGTGMPRDFSHGVVRRWAAGTPTPIAEVRLTGGETSAVVAGLAYNTDTQFDLVLYDNAENESPPSERTTARVQALVDTDFINLKITDAAIVNVDGSKINPGSIETLRLQVGVANLIVDPAWRDDELRLIRSTQTGTSFVTGFGERAGDYTLRRDVTRGTTWLGTTTAHLQTPPQPWIDVQPGSSYYLTLRARSETPTAPGDLRLTIAYLDPETGNFTRYASSPVLALNPAYNDLRWSWSVPDGVYAVAVGVERQSPSSTYAHVASVSMRSRVGGVLIEDGAVTAGKIAALAVTAGTIAANAVTADNLAVGAITAGAIAADAIDVTRLRGDAITAKHTITGALMQTSTLNNRGLKFYGSRVGQRAPGMYLFDPQSNETFAADADTGIVRATGSFRSGMTNSRQAVLAGNLQNEGTGLAANQAGIIFRSVATKARFGQIYDNGSSVRIDSSAVDTGNRRGATVSVDELGVYMYVRGGTINQAAESFQLRNDGFWTLGNPLEDRYGIVRGGYDQQQGNLGFWELRTNAGGSQAVGTANGAWYMGTMNSAGTTVGGDLQSWKIGNSGNQTLCSGDGARNWFLGASAAVSVSGAANQDWFLGAGAVRVLGKGAGGWELGHQNAQKIYSAGGVLAMNGGTDTNSIVFNISDGSFARFQGGTGVFVDGVLNATQKQFVIEHPYETEKMLVHGSTESPLPGVEYWGEAVLDGNGRVRVTLPAYFEALTRTDQRAVLLTAVGYPADLSAGHVIDGGFEVYGAPDAAFFWLVKAARSDVAFDPEPDKTDLGVPWSP